MFVAILCLVCVAGEGRGDGRCAGSLQKKKGRRKVEGFSVRWGPFSRGVFNSEKSGVFNLARDPPRSPRFDVGGTMKSGKK